MSDRSRPQEKSRAAGGRSRSRSLSSERHAVSEGNIRKDIVYSKECKKGAKVCRIDPAKLDLVHLEALEHRTTVIFLTLI